MTTGDGDCRPGTTFRPSPSPFPTDNLISPLPPQNPHPQTPDTSYLTDPYPHLTIQITPQAGGRVGHSYLPPSPLPHICSPLPCIIFPRLDGTVWTHHHTTLPPYRPPHPDSLDVEDSCSCHTLPYSLPSCFPSLCPLDLITVGFSVELPTDG